MIRSMGNMHMANRRLNMVACGNTPTAGVWGSVWMENVSQHGIRDLKITPDVRSFLRTYFFGR